MKLIRVGIVGATGYVGIELVRLLSRHPNVEIKCLVTERYAGQNISYTYPHLKNILDLELTNFNIEDVRSNCDVVFLALPHGKSAEIAALLPDMKVIDLSSDFRLRDRESYPKWYQYDAPPAGLLEKSVYGLPEIGYRAKIAESTLIANPGCYPTAILLASIPSIKANIVKVDECIFDAKSGISGAGRNPTMVNHFCEINENIVPYKLTLHRHIAEIEQELSAAHGSSFAVQFSPHLIAVSRGLLATCYLKLNKSVSRDDVFSIYKEFYQNESFVRIGDVDQISNIKNVKGTNFCDIGITLDNRTNRLVITSAIDNLIKGASGQAIQNMNIMNNLDESAGIFSASTYP